MNKAVGHMESLTCSLKVHSRYLRQKSESNFKTGCKMITKFTVAILSPTSTEILIYLLFQLESVETRQRKAQLVWGTNNCIYE